MRLYLNKKEASMVRTALVLCMAQMNEAQRNTAERILDRIDLCEKLQNNERRSMENV